MAAHDKTEKATPKKREEARKKGQVARSADVNGAAVLMASLLALGAFGPAIAARCEQSLRESLAMIATPEIVSAKTIGTVMLHAGTTVLLATAPVALVCLAAGVVANVAQVRWQPSPGALKPDPSRLNPVSGFKQVFGPHAFVEAFKAVAKVSVVAVIAGLAVVPKVKELGGLVGLDPASVSSMLGTTIRDVAKRVAFAYVVLAALDYAWQRHKFEKQIRMDKQELKDEMKQHSLPAEVKGALRRRQLQAAQARMMAAVPTADVVVTNPTHFSVALRYDGKASAPEVVAKGMDLVALRIREVAREHGVPVVPDPPLARALHASVDVDRQIPEELYQAVARVLAFVYRLEGRRARA